MKTKTLKEIYDLPTRIETDTAWAKKRIEKIAVRDLLSTHAGSLYVIEPLCVTEGRENCGSGPMHVAGLFAEGIHRGCKLWRAEAIPEESGWHNYGAPSGTHTTVAIRYIPAGVVSGEEEWSYR